MYNNYEVETFYTYTYIAYINQQRINRNKLTKMFQLNNYCTLN